MSEASVESVLDRLKLTVAKGKSYCLTLSCDEIQVLLDHCKSAEIRGMERAARLVYHLIDTGAANTWTIEYAVERLRAEIARLREETP